MEYSLGTLFRKSKVLIQVKVAGSVNMGLCYKGVLFSKTVLEPKKVKGKGGKNRE